MKSLEIFSYIKVLCGIRSLLFVSFTGVFPSQVPGEAGADKVIWLQFAYSSPEQLKVQPAYDPLLHAHGVEVKMSGLYSYGSIIPNYMIKYINSPRYIAVFSSTYR